MTAPFLNAMPAHGVPAALQPGGGLQPGYGGYHSVAPGYSVLSATVSSRLPAGQCFRSRIGATRTAIGRSEFSGFGSPLRGLDSPPRIHATVAVRQPVSVQSSSAGDGEGAPGSVAAGATGPGKAPPSGSAAAVAAAAAVTTLRRAPQPRPSVPFFPPDASSEEDEPGPRSRRQTPSQRAEGPQAQTVGGKASSTGGVPGAGAGAVPGRGSVAVSAEGTGREPLRKRTASNSDLDPSRPLPLAMTSQARPPSAEEVQDQLNCDPELQFCKDPIYQWTSKCTKCEGSGYARSFSSRKSGKGKSYSACKCITCCGIGYVYRYTTRSDIPVMGDVEWEGK